MALRLIELPDHPNRIAATDTDSLIPGGTFFLDFTRPLEHRRWLGWTNPWLGVAVGLFVPVIHEGQRVGGYAVGVHRSEPYFQDLRALWKARYPEKPTQPKQEADGTTIIAHFATQFPRDC